MIWFLLFLCFLDLPVNNAGSTCGCKVLRPCYKQMLSELSDLDEVPCIEDAAIGTSTITIFLKAIEKYCSEVIDVIAESQTFEGRQLFEVVLSGVKTDQTKPVIIIDAGQEAGAEAVGFALYIIEQLIGCHEYADMLHKVRWVIMPCVNPDGLEYARFNRIRWTKNLRVSDDKSTFGVDISRNFDTEWGVCKSTISGGFAEDYPGPSASSENETIFIKSVLGKYRERAKAYISIRRDGHSLLYPSAFSSTAIQMETSAAKSINDIVSKVNQKAGTIQLFIKDSIYGVNGKAHCGHSVDYAKDLGIPMALEMRVFLAHHTRIMAKFQTLPKGYESSLRIGYFAGIKELYTSIVKTTKAA